MTNSSERFESNPGSLPAGGESQTRFSRARIGDQERIDQSGSDGRLGKKPNPVSDASQLGRRHSFRGFR